MHRFLRLASSAFLALPPLLLAQASDNPALVNPEKPTPTTITAASRLVSVPVVVRDGKGNLAQSLTQADFSLQVDGKPQVIRYFDVDKDIQLTLGLLVDVSESLRNSLDDERSASSAFLYQMLTGKQDQAFVIEFARSVELLQEITNSRAKLQAGLRDLDTQAAGKDPDSDLPGNSAPDKNGRSHRTRGGSTLYDAVFLASDEIMSRQKGRKALVILTDGIDRGSKERLTDAIEAAQRGDTIVYAIYFKAEAPQHDSYNDSDRGGGFPRGGGYPGGGYPGGGYPGGGYPGGGGRSGGSANEPDQRAESKKTLERIAHETGGRLFEVTKKQPVDAIYAEIGKELRAQYRLGFTPDKDASEEGYYRIALSLANPDNKKFSVQTRDGFYIGK